MSVTFTPDGENQVLVKLTDVFLSYPHIFERYRAKGVGADGKPAIGKFGAKFCFPRSNPQSKADAIAIHQQCVKLAKEVLKAGLPADRICLRDGKQLEESMHPYFVLSASEDTKPFAVDRKRNPVTAEDELFYPGCRVNATVRLWVQNSTEWGKRVNSNLLGIQFVAHGERWGGRAKPKVDDVFDDISNQFEDDEYASGPTGNGIDHSRGGDDGFGDEADGL